MRWFPLRIRQALVIAGMGLTPVGVRAQQPDVTAEARPAQALAVRPLPYSAFSGPPGPDAGGTALLRPTLVADDAARSSWWARHPTATGALAGTVVGLGVYYLQASRDPYCRDPDFFPCELVIPVYVGAGGVAGGLIGYIAGRIARYPTRRDPCV